MSSLYDESGRVDHDKMLELMTLVVANAVETSLFEHEKREEGEMKVLSDMVKEVRDALTGNGFGLESGLIERVKELERAEEAIALEVRGLRQMWLKAKWTMIGIGVGTGLTSGGIAAVIVKVASQ